MVPYRPSPRGERRTSLAAALSPFYQRAVDVVTSLQRRCATALYESAKAALAKKIEDDATARSSARFSSSAQRRAAADDAIANDALGVDPVPPDAPFADHLDEASRERWSTPSCRPAQLAAVDTILFSEACRGKLLVVDRTGGRKSHILRMIATFVGGIVLVIVPLLTLTADQLAKPTRKASRFFRYRGSETQGAAIDV